MRWIPAHFFLYKFTNISLIYEILRCAQDKRPTPNVKFGLSAYFSLMVSISVVASPASPCKSDGMIIFVA